MSRRDSAIKREVLQDPVYNSQLVTRFINVIMRDGKKSIAERIVYDALESIGEKSEDDPMKVFKRAIENVKPAVEVKSRRVGGSTYQVPVEVRPSRRMALAFRWLIQSAMRRGERTMKQRLAAELSEAAENRGGAIKKKEDTHRMAEANKAFAHYRW
jgi:small subunit ribosomal protein S7